MGWLFFVTWAILFLLFVVLNVKSVETSESFYKSVKIGQVISADVKSGSFWIDGDISKLEIKIEDKKIK